MVEEANIARISLGVLVGRPAGVASGIGESYAGDFATAGTTCSTGVIIFGIVGEELAEPVKEFFDPGTFCIGDGVADTSILDTDSGRAAVVIGEEFGEGGTFFDFVGRNHALCGGGVFSVGFELAREPVFEIITVDEGRKSIDIKDDDWVTIDIAFYTNTLEGGARTIGGVIGSRTAGSRGAWNDGDERIVSQSGERCESRRERGRREEIRRKVGGY